MSIKMRKGRTKITYKHTDKGITISSHRRMNNGQFAPAEKTTIFMSGVNGNKARLAEQLGVLEHIENNGERKQDAYFRNTHIIIH